MRCRYEAVRSYFVRIEHFAVGVSVGGLGRFRPRWPLAGTYVPMRIYARKNVRTNESAKPSMLTMSAIVLATPL